MELFQENYSGALKNDMHMLSDLQLVYMVPRNSTQLLNINTTKLQLQVERYTVGEQKRFLSSRKILSIVIMCYWLQCC